MGEKAIKTGVAPGGLTDRDEVNLLMCYLLTEVEVPLSKEDVIEVLSELELVNYFEAADAFENQVERGNIKKVGRERDETLYTATETGKEIVKQLRTSLPFTVREKTVKATLRFLHRRRRLEENKVEIKEAENGYIVTCRILDKTDDLLSMQMLVPNMAHAELVKKQFLNDPILLYTGVLNILTDNLSALRNIKPSPNNDLF